MDSKIYLHRSFRFGALLGLSVSGLMQTIFKKTLEQACA